MARIPGTETARRALAVRLPARLARIDRWRLRRLNGMHIGARTSSGSLRLAGYQVARFPVAAALAALAYTWWANNLLLLILPFIAQRRLEVVLYGWHFGDVAVGPGGVTAGVMLGVVLVFAGVQVLLASAAIDAALARALLGRAGSPRRSPVLDERGLDAALSGLIAGCPVPVRVDVTLSRCPDPH